MISTLVQQSISTGPPPEVWILGGWAILIFLTCAGVALIIRSLTVRTSKINDSVNKSSNDTHKNVNAKQQENISDAQQLANRLHELRTKRFSQTDDLELYEPQNYKIPSQKIRNTKQQHYKRQQEPTEIKEKEIGTTTRKKNR